MSSNTKNSFFFNFIPLLINIIDGMDWFSQVLDMIFAAKEISSDTVINGKSVQDRRARLIDFTQQMVDANKNKDWVLLADLLEYEILSQL